MTAMRDEDGGYVQIDRPLVKNNFKTTLCEQCRNNLLQQGDRVVRSVEIEYKNRLLIQLLVLKILNIDLVAFSRYYNSKIHAKIRLKRVFDNSIF